jgi:hypothetical protein
VSFVKLTMSANKTVASANPSAMIFGFFFNRSVRCAKILDHEIRK